MTASRVLIGLLKALGYLAFFAVATLFFTWLTFPTEAVRDYVEARASDSLGSPVRIGELELSGISGVELRQVTVRLDRNAAGGPLDGAPTPGAAEGDEGAKRARPRLLSADRLSASVDLWGLLFGDGLAVDFEGDIQGGEVRGGRYTRAADGQARLEIAEIRDVRLGADGLLLRMIKYDLRGLLSGKIDMQLGATAHAMRGTLDLALADAKVVEPVVPTKQFGPIELGDIDLGTLAIQVNAAPESEIAALKKRRARPKSGDDDEPTVLHLEQLAADGKDIELQTDGQSAVRVVAGRPLSAGRLELHLAVHIQDDYLERTVPGPDGQLQEPNKILKMAIKQDRRLRTMMRDGVIGVYCRGVVGRPDCGIERSRVRGGFSKVRKPTFGGGDSEPEASDDGAEEEPEDEDEDEGARSPRRVAPRRATTAPSGGSARSSKVAEDLRERNRKRLEEARERARLRREAMQRGDQPATGRPQPAAAASPATASPLTTRPAISPEALVRDDEAADDEGNAVEDEEASEESEEEAEEEAEEGEVDDAPAEEEPE